MHYIRTPINKTNNNSSPSMAKIKGTIIVDIDRCKGCEICIAACPFTILELSKMVNSKGYNYSQIKSSECTGCASCAIMCPDSCITVYRQKQP